jgi:hypothetical protein
VIILFDKEFKCSNGANFLGYVEINAESLCVESCNFVHCVTFVRS